MLSDASVERFLERAPNRTFGVLGDLFLDRYLEIDAALTEPSIETGLDAYQVVRVRASPGAAGTVVNNLVALGAGRVCVIAVIGDDGEGYELRQALQSLAGVDTRWIFSQPERRTPTYTKPMLHEYGRPARELNRLDIKNRSVLAPTAEARILEALDAIWPQVDVLLVADQVSEADCGVVTAKVRERLAQLGEAQAEKIVLVDSRERIGQFRAAWLKPNRSECVGAVQTGDESMPFSEASALARRAGRPVFCTCGERGILVVDPRGGERTVQVPAYPVQGPIDIVGAGDSTSAGIACALAAGAELEEAAAFGNLVASITIQQLGTTGTASPSQVRARWREVRS
jgi:rfaE bifunctional protein kinase chain/domain